MTEIVVSRAGAKGPQKNVGLAPLPPIAQEVATEQGIDPRTHGRKEHAAFGKDWSRATKELRLLQRPSAEDEEIRDALRAAGLPIHNVARSQSGPLSPDETGFVHVITDLPPAG